MSVYRGQLWHTGPSWAVTDSGQPWNRLGYPPSAIGWEQHEVMVFFPWILWIIHPVRLALPMIVWPGKGAWQKSHGTLAQSVSSIIVTDGRTPEKCSSTKLNKSTDSSERWLQAHDPIDFMNSQFLLITVKVKSKGELMVWLMCSKLFRKLPSLSAWP